MMLTVVLRPRNALSRRLPFIKVQPVARVDVQIASPLSLGVPALLGALVYVNDKPRFM